MVVMPAFYLDEAVEPPLAYLAIRPPLKGGKAAPAGAEPLLNHRSVLGSIMGLGLKRGKIGDILLGTEEAQVVVAAEMIDAGVPRRSFMRGLDFFSVAPANWSPISRSRRPPRSG